MHRPLRLPHAALVAGAALGGLVFVDPPGAGAGCLAPADTVVDVANAVGPFWGNEQGTLLYARDLTGTQESLVLRTFGGGPETLAAEGTRNGFSVGTAPETWSAFHGGTVNSTDDVAFVASTTLPDDTTTTLDESVPRRGVYAHRGNTTFEIARFGNPSPFFDPFGAQVPWATVFDAAALGRNAQGRLEIVFSAQLGQPDGRIGFFRWSESTLQVTPILLTGEPSPAGGTFETLGRLRANEAGDLAFFAVTRLSDTAPGAPGLFLADAAGNRMRVVKFGTDGDGAPGGGRFAILGDFDIDDARALHFAGSVQEGPVPSGLFRAEAPFYVPQIVLREADATPLGGAYETWTAAVVRANPDGEVAVDVLLTDEIGGHGLFTIPAGSTGPVPLVNPERTVGAAALGAGRMAYSTPTETHVVFPADGTDEGPTDFRIVRVDVRNAVALGADSIRIDGRFLLPPWGEGGGDEPPVVFPRAGAVRFAAERRYDGADLTRIVEARLSVSTGPGNTFIFRIGGTDEAPVGSVTANNIDGTVSRLKISKEADAAQWKFRAPVGNGSLTVDLDAETFSLRLARGSILPSFDPRNFRVAFTLRTAADAGDAVADSFFHREVRLDAQAPNFGSGRRVVSKGQGVAGGTLFVDALRVSRKLQARRGVAAPVVDSDKVQLAGTLLLCPGATAPATPTVRATLVLGDLVLSDVELERKGKGPSYRYRSPRGSEPAVDLRVDVARGTFAFTAKSVPPLAQLVDADFSGTHPTNDAKLEVGGMELPFTLSVARVYEADLVIPMVRRPGGKVFER